MKISDEAQELANQVRKHYSSHAMYTFVEGQSESVIVGAEECQTALNAAYNRGLEVVEKYYAEKIKAYADMPDSMMKSFALDVFKMSADAIRAMKVKP